MNEVGMEALKKATVYFYVCHTAAPIKYVRVCDQVTQKNKVTHIAGENKPGYYQSDRSAFYPTHDLISKTSLPFLNCITVKLTFSFLC